MTLATDPGAGPSRFFTDDHRHCDALWAKVEAAADGGDSKEAARLFAEFDRAVRLHLDVEEQILFPKLEAATGMHGFGPTQVMRAEHAQMRGVLDAMARAASTGNVDGVLDHGDTLLMLIQQHNLKEEGILYPMAERALGGAWGPIADAIGKAYKG
jgi:iron-sulfur cluster repair protein YtfE (RIC family)